MGPNLRSQVQQHSERSRSTSSPEPPVIEIYGDEVFVRGLRKHVSTSASSNSLRNPHHGHHFSRKSIPDRGTAAINGLWRNIRESLQIMKPKHCQGNSQSESGESEKSMVPSVPVVSGNFSNLYVSDEEESRPKKLSGIKCWDNLLSVSMDVHRADNYVIPRREVTSCGAIHGTFVFKVLVIGAPGSGKTSMVQRYVNDHFESDYKATLGDTTMAECKGHNDSGDSNNGDLEKSLKIDPSPSSESRDSFHSAHDGEDEDQLHLIRNPHKFTSGVYWHGTRSVDQRDEAYGRVGPAFYRRGNISVVEVPCKVVIIGDPGVGKTSFVQRYICNKFSAEYRWTVGVDFALKVVRWSDNVTVKLQMWDIAGQERFTSMTRVYYKDAHACVIMFDLTQRGSFLNALKWKRDLDQKCSLPDGKPVPCILLANKCDLECREVEQTEIEGLCQKQEFIGWTEVSVKEGLMVEESMRFLLDDMIARYAERNPGVTDSEALDMDRRSNVYLKSASHQGIRKTCGC